MCSDVIIPESNRKIFFDLLSDLKKGLKRSADKQVTLNILMTILGIVCILIRSSQPKFYQNLNLFFTVFYIFHEELGTATGMSLFEQERISLCCRNSTADIETFFVEEKTKSCRLEGRAHEQVAGEWTARYTLLLNNIKIN